MGTRWARFARGWVAAVFSTLVAALSHSLADDAAPSVLAIVLSLAFAGIACIALAGAKTSRWRLAGSVAFSQVLFHGLFSSLGGPTLLAPGAGDHMHGAIALISQAGTGHSAAATWQMGPWMLAAHVAAGIVTFLVLRYGEAAYWDLSDRTRVLIRTRYPEFSSLPAIGAPRLNLAVSRVFAPLSTGILISVMRYRGPPLSGSLA